MTRHRQMPRGRVQQRQRSQYQPGHKPRIGATADAPANQSHDQQAHRRQAKVEVRLDLVCLGRTRVVLRHPIHPGLVPSPRCHHLVPVSEWHVPVTGVVLASGDILALAALFQLPCRQQLHRCQSERQAHPHDRSHQQPPSRRHGPFGQSTSSPPQPRWNIEDQDQLGNKSQVEVACQHLQGKHQGQQQQAVAAWPCQEPLGHPQRRRQPRAPQDRPLQHNSWWKPAININQPHEPTGHVTQAHLTGVSPGEDEGQDVVHQLHRVVCRVDTQYRIQQVERIEEACLALAHYRVSMSHPVVPKRQLATNHVLGQVRLLGKEVGVDVTTQQAATGVQRPPEDQRQPQADHRRHQPATPRDPGGRRIAGETACR